MAERSRVNSSTAAEMASGGSAGFSRSNAARNRDTNTTSPFVSRPSVPPAPNISSSRRHRLPAKLREQPDGGLLDKLVFGVGVGHGSVRLQIHLPRKQARQQQVARPAEVLDLAFESLSRLARSRNFTVA